MTTPDDDHRQQLLEAQQVARDLEPEKTAAITEALRNRIARQFFGEAGIPPELARGWAVLEKLREHRIQVGYPLPPGGCLLLGRESVLAGALAELHTSLAEMLHLSVDNIKLRMDRSPEGYLRPVADVETPSDWLIPAAKDPRQSPEEASEQYIAACLEAAQAHFRAAVVGRLDYCDTMRPALAQREVWGAEEV